VFLSLFFRIYRHQQNIHLLNITPIIIINWNGIQDTHECVNSLLALEIDNYHIHLIDNNSDNGEGNQLRDQYLAQENLTFHQYDKNYGFTKAHLKIWKDELQNSNYEYIALLNNDTAVDKKWLVELLNVARSHNADIVSSKMINYDNRSLIDNVGHFMLTTGEIMPIGSGDHVSKYTEVIATFGACAGACLYSTKMIKNIGFFDPFFTTGYEDAELGLRATVLNYKSVYAPKAIVFHKRGQSISKIFNIDYSIMIHSSILYSYFKNVPLLNIVFSLPFLIFKYVSMLLINIIFERKQYLRIMCVSWRNTVNNLKYILNERSKLKSYKKLNSLKLRNKMTFFFKIDMKRFWNIIVQNNESNLDKY